MALILASSSPIRKALLDQAGLDYAVVRPDCDEDAVKAVHHGSAAALAQTLAEAKAASVASGRPDDWVIGSDSVVSVDGRLFDKPADRDEAAEHLRFFSGKTIALSSAVALARGDAIEWSHAETANLLVRQLSEGFIADYLDAEWPDVAYCVGVFRMEARGVTLFERIEGSHFTILGLPLLPLLGALRERKVIAS